MTMRMMPPADGLHPAITISGRSYSCALGATVDMPDQDGFVAAANGWTVASSGGSGTTAQRPAAPAKGDEYHDTTVGSLIKFDGKVWRNPHSGASV